ncbi:MAG: hypothetical protein Q9217_001587 [Psora testacea]
MFSAHDTSPPPAYDGRDRVSSDAYLSEDEDLSDDDLDVLNTDYNLQRGLTFFPHDQIPIHSRRPLPPSNRPQHSRSADDLPALSEKDSMDSHALRSGLFPPREASFRDTQAMSRYDYPDYRLPHHTPQRNAYAYQDPARRRPLIDFIKNEWKHNPYTHASTSPPASEHFDMPIWVQICFAPRFQRSVFVFLMLFFLVWGNWKTWAGQKMDESYRLRASSKERMKNPEGWFGVNMRPEFLDMVQVGTLDDELMPSQKNEKRLIVIGDVHGCSEELVALLAELQYEARTDHLIFTGDMISKGPSSPAVVDLAISAHASCVRGNHEDRVLLTYRDLSAHSSSSSKKKTPPPAPGIPEDASVPEEQADGEEKLEGDASSEPDHELFSRLDWVDQHLARQLNKRQIEYLSQCPVILDIGQIAGMGDVHVVHAGLVPGVRLERQDPIGVMHMRTVDLDTHVPSSSGKGTAWFKALVKLWNKYQNFLPAQKRSTIIYGHDSHRGLQLENYSKGIDTGCVKGGKLSAFIIDKNSHVVAPRVVSVECKDYRHLEKDLVRNAGKKSV